MNSPQIIVAPMEGVTHFPMRLWLTSIAQPKFMTSPFLRVTRVYPENELPELFAPELFRLQDQVAYELVPQFIATDIEAFLRACELIPPAVSRLIELNCGCPSPNSMGALAGSGMLRDPGEFAAMIELASERLGPGRLAVKMRLGIENDAEFPKLLKQIAHLPLGRLTIHARTRSDGYRGKARWSLIREAIDTCSYPIIASGDVWGIDSYLELTERVPGLSGVMIGRGLLRNPWIFSEIANAKPTTMTAETLIQSLYVFLLLQHLAHKDAHKLLAKAEQGQCALSCSADTEAWKRQAAMLSNLALGRPQMLLKGQSHVTKELSPVAYHRLRFLWTYLRSSLPQTYRCNRLVKARNAGDFFDQLFDVAELESEITLQHSREWDSIFSRERG